MNSTVSRPVLGISSYSYPWTVAGNGQGPAGLPMELFLLEQAKRLGVYTLQLADNLPLHQLAADRLHELVKRAADYQIGLEVGMRGWSEGALLEYLAIAETCASPFLRVVIDKEHYQPSQEQILAVIRKVLPAFEKSGIVLAIENHDRFRAEELVQIIEATDPEYVGICLDTANSLGADEGLRQVATLLAPYTVNLHYKDYRIRRVSHQMGFRVTGVPAGKGQIPAGWLLDLMRSSSRCRSIILEIWLDPLDDPEATRTKEAQWVEESIRFLKTHVTT